jgi:AraC-like DNA-binding protein
MEYDFSALPMKRVSSKYSSRKFPLHALTLLSGHNRETSAAYHNDGRQEPSSYAVWQYSLSGRGRLDLRDRSWDLRPGSLLILGVPGPHAYYLPADSDHWEFVFLVLIGREAIRITRMVEQRLGPVLSSAGKPKTLALLYEILEKLFSGEIHNPFINSSYTYRLCMTFLEESGGDEENRGGRSFDVLKAFLRDNLRRDISVEEMAEIMGLSRSHLTRLFSREMGMSPRMYLEDLRLKTAMGILFEEKASIKETAARCGISDVNYFCRLFKKRYGISPGKYKEKER